MNEKRIVTILALMLLPCALAHGGKPAARLGDMTAHGGSIVVGLPTVLIGGMPAARVGDMHVCPMLNPGVPPPPHVGGPIMMGSPMVLIGGMPAARMGDMVTCAGPPDTIMLGCMTVLIGEGGSGSAGGGATADATGVVSATVRGLSIRDKEGGLLTLENGVVVDSMATGFPLFAACEDSSQVSCPVLGYALWPSTYTATLSNYQDGVGQFAFYTDTVRYLFERHGASPLQVDQVSLGDRFGMTSIAGGEGPVVLSAVMTAEAAQRIVDLVGLTLPVGDSLYMTVGENQQLQVTNLGGAKQYTLRINSFENGMFKAETVANISLAPRNLQMFSPPWGSMGLYPIKISFDRNLDGVLDELMYVSQLTSAQQIANILKFFDQSVANGTLVGSGPANSADGRRKALRNMLKSASNMIADGETDDALEQLVDAYKKMDGNPDPPDFVEGPARADLARLVDNLIKTMSGIIPIENTPVDKSPVGDTAIANKAVQPAEADPAVPTEFGLYQNYPNPFNPSTTIRYGLPVKSRVTLTVFNALGQHVAVIEEGERDAGFYEIRFDGSNLASGVYFYRLEAGDFVRTHKFILIK